MKSGAKVKRVLLKDNQSSNTAIIGIVSSEPDYKLSLAINRKLKISLKNDSPILIIEDAGNNITFSMFSDASGSPHLCYDLTSNRSGKNFLIKRLKNIDFIFQVHNPVNDETIRKIVATLKETECITAVFLIDPVTIKDKNLQYLIQ
jgi:hypothetical protein